MTDSRFLDWIADRLVHVYGASPNVDFVLRLREMARTVGVQVVIPKDSADPLTKRAAEIMEARLRTLAD